MPASKEKYVLPITFQSFTSKNVEQLKVLNSVIFPIKYPVSRYIHASFTTVMTANAIKALQEILADNLLSSVQAKVYDDCLIYTDLTQGGRAP